MYIDTSRGGYPNEVSLFNSGGMWFQDAPQMIETDFLVTDERGYAYIGQQISEEFKDQIYF